MRHGRTAWNRGRFLGRADVPLDDEGLAQAGALVTAFAGRRVDAVCSSPLRRARDTAAPLASERGLAVAVWDDLAELDCGTWEGEVKEGHAKLSKRAPDDPFPGGESLSAAMVRVGGAIAAIRRAHPDGAHVAVVAHYMVNQLALGALRGHDVTEALHGAGYRPAPGSALAVRLEHGVAVATEPLA